MHQTFSSLNFSSHQYLHSFSQLWGLHFIIRVVEKVLWNIKNQIIKRTSILVIFVMEPHQDILALWSLLQRSHSIRWKFTNLFTMKNARKSSSLLLYNWTSIWTTFPFCKILSATLVYNPEDIKILEESKYDGRKTMNENPIFGVKY